MKNLRPSQLLLIGSAGIFLIGVLLLTVWSLFIEDLSIQFILLLPFFFAGLSYLIFYLLIKRFVNDRLKLLYRTIRRGKITKDSETTFSLVDDPIAKAEEETKKWSEAKQEEISKLKEQEEFRREFLGNLAHELKTPVFSIQGYLLTLLEGGLEDENVNMMFLERASKATDRMVSMLEDLDQITKLEADELTMQMRPFVINDVVQDVFEQLELRASEKNITLKFARNYDPISVKADRSKITQVFANLIGNSIAYGNEGGETLVRFYVLDGVVTTEVSDNGPGIDEVNIPRLFERFYRVEKSRNRNDGGSGLGLAIVKHIIESHNQTISVRSTVGIGSTFIFTLDSAK